MSSDIHPGDCVQLPEGRIGRVRERAGDTYTVRVRRTTSKTHQYLRFRAHRSSVPSSSLGPKGRCL
jgi:hypothetical protein